MTTMNRRSLLTRIGTIMLVGVFMVTMAGCKSWGKKGCPHAKAQCASKCSSGDKSKCASKCKTPCKKADGSKKCGPNCKKPCCKKT